MRDWRHIKQRHALAKSMPLSCTVRSLRPTQSAPPERRMPLLITKYSSRCRKNAENISKPSGMGYIFVTNASTRDRYLAEAPKAGHNDQHPYRNAKHLTTAFLKIGPRQRTDDAFYHLWVPISRLPRFPPGHCTACGLEQAKGV